MGSIINFAAIIAGGGVGLLCRRFMKPSMQEAIEKVLGFCVFLLGTFGVFTSMASVTVEGRIETNGFLLLIVSLAIGGILGELLEIDAALRRTGEKLERKLKVSSFSEGFLTATIPFCVGAMAVIGSLNDGLTGDSSVLIAKAVIDGVCAIFFAARLGAGVLFSAIPVLLYQGAITLLAKAISPLITQQFLDRFCMVGYAIVATIGLSLMRAGKFKPANLMPAMIFPILYSIFFK